MFRHFDKLPTRSLVPEISGSLSAGLSQNLRMRLYAPMFISVHKGACADSGLTLQTTNLKFPVSVLCSFGHARARTLLEDYVTTITIFVGRKNRRGGVGYTVALV